MLEDAGIVPDNKFLILTIMALFNIYFSSPTREDIVSPLRMGEVEGIGGSIFDRGRYRQTFADRVRREREIAMTPAIKGMPMLERQMPFDRAIPTWSDFLMQKPILPTFPRLETVLPLAIRRTPTLPWRTTPLREEDEPERERDILTARSAITGPEGVPFMRRMLEWSKEQYMQKLLEAMKVGSRKW